MKEFMGMYAKSICGAISGWDRIRFRGTIRWLASTQGLNSYLGTRRILLKDFGKWAKGQIRDWGFDPEPPPVLKAATKAAKDNPESADALADLALAQIRNRRAARSAEATARKALKIDPQ